MKQKVALFLAIVLLVSSLCACAKNGDTSAADTYLSMAQDFISKGDHTSAMEILQKGFSETKDERIAVMMAELTSTNTQNTDNVQATIEQTTLSEALPSATDVAAYAGTWAESEISWVYGGVILDLAVEGDMLNLTISLTQSAPASRIAEFNQSVPVNNIKDNKLDVSFDNDGWGVSGKLSLVFAEDRIDCRFYETKENDIAPMWGFHDEDYILVRNSMAHDAMSYTMEDYNALNATDTDEPLVTQPVYDLSKASGILAQAGLTEEGFRALCEPLTERYYNFQYNATSLSTTVLAQDRYHFSVGQQYYQNNPQETAVQEATAEWEAICADYNSGGTEYQRRASAGMFSTDYHLFEKYKTLDLYLSDTVYCPKGYDICHDKTESTLAQMEEFPNQFVNQEYVLIGFDMKPNANYIYEDEFAATEIKVRDLRDDVSNPNVIAGKDYYLYVVFRGTSANYSGDIILHFDLLSLEKIAD